MKLYLSSYRLGNKTEELEDWIDKYGNEIILIPNAQDMRDDEMEKMKIDRNVEDLTLVPGFNVKVVSLKDYFGKYEQLKQDFKNCHAFFAIGGNVFTLRKAMQLSGFDTFLKENANRDDLLYAGYSAGICVLAPSLRGFEFVDDPINPYNQESVMYDGIGILDYMPIPHCNPGHEESEEVKDVVEYCIKNGVKHKTLKDGDVIVQEAIKKQEREHDDR